MKIIFSYNANDLKKERKIYFDYFKFKICLHIKLFTH